MAKYARKIRAGLQSRVADWEATKGPGVNPQSFHKPGSQNVHKTGYDPAPKPAPQA